TSSRHAPTPGTCSSMAARCRCRPSTVTSTTCSRTGSEMTTRRDFLGLLGAGAIAPALPAPFPDGRSLPPISDKWEMSWVDRVSAPHKAVIDSPEVSEGGALYRAVMLRDQYREVYGTFPDQF